MRTEILHTKDKKMEEETEPCYEGGNKIGSAPEEPPGILKLEDVDGTCDKGDDRGCGSSKGMWWLKGMW